MEKKTVAELYCELDKKGYKDFMFDTGNYINHVCREHGLKDFFECRDEGEILNVSGYKCYKPFSLLDHDDEPTFEFKEDDALNLVSMLDLYNIEHNHIFFKKDNPCVYFIDKQGELFFTCSPEEFLEDVYTTSMGCKKEYATDRNALFDIDRFSGKLSLNRIYQTEKECNEFILEHCMNSGFISYGTDSADLIKDYYNNLIEDLTSDDMTDDEIEAVKNWQEQLNKLNKYLNENLKELSNKKLDEVISLKEYSELKDMKKNDPITKFRKDFSDYVENSGIASEYAFRETYDSQKANDPHKFAYSCIFSFGSGFEHEISFTDVQDLTAKLVASLPESVDSMLADSESMPLKSLPKEHQKATLELFKEIEGVKKFLQSYKEELSQEITDTVSSEKKKINSNTVWSMLLDYDITKTDTQISLEGDDYKVVQKVSLSDDRNKNSIELEREIRYMLEKSSADPAFPDYELKRTDLKDSSKRSAFHICLDGQKTDDQDYKDVLDIIEDIAYQGAATDDERKIERMILDMVDQEPKIEQKISSEYGIVNDPDFSMQFNDLFLFSKEEKLSHAESFIEENNPFPNVNELFKYDEIQKKKPLSQYCEECLKAYGDNLNDQEMKLIADHMKANYTLAVMITDAAVTDLGIEQNDPKLTLNHDSYKEMLSEIKQKGESFSCEDAHELAAKYAASLNYGGKSIKSYKELNSNSLTM